MKLVIKNMPYQTEPTLELGLRYSGDSVRLVNFTKLGSEEFTILTIHPDGTLYRNRCIPNTIGLSVDDKGRIKLVNE